MKKKDNNPSEDLKPVKEESGTETEEDGTNILAKIMGIQVTPRRNPPRAKKVSKPLTATMEYSQVIKGLGGSKSKRKKPATALSSSSEDEENKVITKWAPRKRMAVRKVCPKCIKTFTSLLSYNNHTKVCDIKKVPSSTKVPSSKKRKSSKIFPLFDDRTRPMCKLPPYSEEPYQFITQFGVVQIISDENIPCDGSFGQTIVNPVTAKPEQTRRNLWKLRLNARNNARKLRDYSKWQEGRKWIDVLYQQYIYPGSAMSGNANKQCEVISVEEKEQYSSVLPGIIAGKILCKDENTIFMKHSIEDDEYEEDTLEYPPLEYMNENVVIPKDSYPERIVECIVVDDKRSRLLKGQNHPEELIYDTVSCLPMKLYIQRQSILKFYVDTYKKCICYDCGCNYSLISALFMHLGHKACVKKIMPPRLCDMMLDYDSNYKPKISNKKQKQQKREGSVNAAFEHFGELPPMKPSPKQPEQTPITQAKQPRKARKPKQKKPIRFAPCNSMYTQIFQYLGYQRKRMSVVKTIKTKGIYDQVLDFLHFKPGLLHRRSTTAIRRQNIQVKQYGGIPAPKNLDYVKRKRGPRIKDTDTYSGLVDLRVIVQEIMTGRYPSIKPYEGKHVDKKCQICKKEHQPIYPCEFCWRSFHVDCLYEKRPFVEFDPHADTFICNACVGYVLSRRARAQRRTKRKMEKMFGTSSKAVYYGSAEQDQKGYYTTEEEDGGAETDNFTDGNITDVQEEEENNGQQVDSSMQDLVKKGKELNELLQLTAYTQLRLKRAIFLSQANDRRRSLF